MPPTDADYYKLFTSGLIIPGTNVFPGAGTQGIRQRKAAHAPAGSLLVRARQALRIDVRDE
jgi:hypothetical protein